MAPVIKHKKKLFIFDLDGTLADVYTAIERSLNFTRNTLGYSNVSYRVIKRSVGRGDRLFMEAFFGSEDIIRALRIFRKHHKESVRRYSRLMPFAKQLLKKLKERKKYVAIASNRPTVFTNRILKVLDIKKYIDYVLCADRAKRIKPCPDMLINIIRRFKVSLEDAVYVGDMAIDLEAARRAKIDSVFVKGGSGVVKEARAYAKARIISSLGEILRIYE